MAGSMNSEGMEALNSPGWSTGSTSSSAQGTYVPPDGVQGAGGDGEAVSRVKPLLEHPSPTADYKSLDTDASLDQAGSPLLPQAAAVPSGASYRDYLNAEAAATTATRAAARCGTDPSSNSSGSTAEPLAQEEELVQLTFLSVLNYGHHGTVLAGTCNGQPAAIKVYDWDGGDDAVYDRETGIYEVLARLQGSVVPKVLAKGRLTGRLGCVRILALQMVEGWRPLSDCPRPFPPQVVRAALDALDAVHTAGEGFVHGNIALENMLLVGGEAELVAGRGGGGSGSGSSGPMSGQSAAQVVEAGMEEGAARVAPQVPAAAQTTVTDTAEASAAPCGGGGSSALRCVLLDFAGSWLDGTEEEQEEERAELRRLLGAPAH